MRAGPVEIEPELVEAVLAETRAGEIELGAGGPSGIAFAPSEGVEAPYLQLVLTRLWQAEPEAGSDVLPPGNSAQGLGGARRVVHGHLEEGGWPRWVRPSRTSQPVGSSTTSSRLPARRSPTAWADLAAYCERLAEGDLVPVLSTSSLSCADLPMKPPADGSGETRYEIFHDVLAEPVSEWLVDRVPEERRLESERASLAKPGTGGCYGARSGVAVRAGDRRRPRDLRAHVSAARHASRRSAAQLARARGKRNRSGPEDAELCSARSRSRPSTSGRRPEAERALRSGLLASRTRLVLGDLTEVPPPVCSFARTARGSRS